MQLNHAHSIKENQTQLFVTAGAVARPTLPQRGVAAQPITAKNGIRASATTMHAMNPRTQLHPVKGSFLNKGQFDQTLKGQMARQVGGIHRSRLNVVMSAQKDPNAIVVQGESKSYLIKEQSKAQAEGVSKAISESVNLERSKMPDGSMRFLINRRDFSDTFGPKESVKIITPTAEFVYNPKEFAVEDGDASSKAIDDGHMDSFFEVLDNSAPLRRVAKSLIQEMTPAEKDEFSKLPFIEIEDLEQVHYL